jgi:uncharacterized coiled-coil DUF342 family protein
MSNVTYRHEDKLYDPKKFSDEAKKYFNQIVELNVEIEKLHKKIAVLQAASIDFNRRIKEQLTSAMETTTQTVEEKITESLT